MSYLVFLDIDGVFTSTRVQMASFNYDEIWSKFDPTAVDFMNRLYLKHDIQFVVISTWKDGLQLKNRTEEHWVISAFRNAGFIGDFAPEWMTRTDLGREEGVKEYLDSRDVDDFLIFDDYGYNYNIALRRRRHIKTDPEEGLLTKHMKKTLAITGEWDKR